jgi:hypothetical protein
MLKLARTLLEAYKLLRVPGLADEAKWHHIQQLYELQESEGLSLANKLTKQHVNFHTQKMKVKLATQVLSASVANAMKFLRLQNHELFRDSEATELYVETFDKLFDILNSRSLYASGYKKAINRNNVHSVLAWMKRTREFLMKLEDSTGKKIINTKKRMCVMGFCSAIDSVTHLCRQLLCSSTGVNGVRLQYLLTYRLSQDHVELLFGLIRRRGGNSDSPTCQQFRWAYRAVLSKIGVVSSTSANVIPLDTSDCLILPEKKSTQLFDDTDMVEQDYWETLPVVSHIAENICAYMAGYVIRKLIPRLKCAECRQLLVSTDATSDNTAFLRLKNNGGLVVPSASAIHVVTQSERWLRKLIDSRCPATSLAKVGLQLEISILSELNPSAVFGDSAHGIDTSDGIDNHLHSLVRQIVRFYISIRKYRLLKMWNLQHKGTSVRQKLTKLIHFKHQ